MKKGIASVSVVCVLLASLAAFPVCAATTVTYILGPSGQGDQIHDPASPVTKTETSNPQGSTTFASFTAFPTNGTIKSSFDAKSTGAGATDSFVNSSFSDIVTFGNAVLNGQQAFAQIKVFYNWTVDAAASGPLSSAFARNTLTVALGGGAVVANESKHVGCAFNGNCTVDGETLQVSPHINTTLLSSIPQESFVASVPISFGQPLSLLVTDAMAVTAHGTANGNVDVAHSVYWGGIVGVTDAGGNPVNFNLTSDSGVDYTKSFAPVPEPAMVSLLFAGFGIGFAVMGLRRKQFGIGTNS